MALNNITIVVVDGGSLKDGNIFDKPSTTQVGERPTLGKQSALYKVLNYNRTLRRQFAQATSPATAFAAHSAIQLAKSTARQAAQFYLSDIGRRTGDSNYQAMINDKIEAITEPLGIFGSALSGAATGAMFGPWGAAIGAVIGLAGSAISSGFKQAEQTRAYQHQMFKDSTSQAYNLARADFNRLTGRLR